MPPGAGPNEPTLRRPASPRASARARPIASSAAARIVRASATSASPAAVSSTRRVLRISSGPPSSRSSWRTCALTADCARPAGRRSSLAFGIALLVLRLPHTREPVPFVAHVLAPYAPPEESPRIQDKQHLHHAD